MRTWALLTLLFTFLPAGVSAQSAEDAAPAYESVDWTEAIAAEIGPDVCAAPIEVRPASLASDELRAVDLLRRTLSDSGRQTVLASETAECLLSVHTPTQARYGLWNWAIDVRGTKVGTVNLQVSGARVETTDDFSARSRRLEIRRKYRRKNAIIGVVAGVGVLGLTTLLVVGIVALVNADWSFNFSGV